MDFGFNSLPQAVDKAETLFRRPTIEQQEQRQQHQQHQQAS